MIKTQKNIEVKLFSESYTPTIDFEPNKIMQKFKQDITNEEQLKQKYNYSEFKEKQVKNISSNTVQEEIRLVEYKKENIFIKLINMIKSLFKRK